MAFQVRPVKERTLGPRERMAAELAARGVPYKEIARRMKISMGTIKVYISRAYDLLGVKNRAQLAALLFPFRSDDSALLMGDDIGNDVRMGAFE